MKTASIKVIAPYLACMIVIASLWHTQATAGITDLPLTEVTPGPGEGDNEALCPTLSRKGVASAVSGRGHHPDNEYQAIAERLLTFTGRTYN